jgi:hypothetical protein
MNKLSKTVLVFQIIAAALTIVVLVFEMNEHLKKRKQI